MRNIYLVNPQNKVLRSIGFQGEEGEIIVRKDDSRIQLLTDVKEFEKEGVEFTRLGSFQVNDLEKKDFQLGELGRLSMADPDSHLENISNPEDDPSIWRKSFLMMILGSLIFVFGVLNIPRESPQLEEELKQHIVKIIKQAPKEKSVRVIGRQVVKKTEPTTEPKKSIRRMGALAVLGSLNRKNSKQRGGINLGAVQTTPGPGLGGKAGSGGVQTSLYGKGLITAPVGAGSNIKGGGGYGTKGRGGGQAGYGQLSLIGSVGTASIPLGKEAIIEGGLDQDLIYQVIQKNMGQVRFCYEQGLQSDPKLGGRVAVGFVIGGNGRVKSALVNNTTLNAKTVEDCILMRLRTWKFPEPEGGVDVSVSSVPFVLQRRGSG